jgi:V8-like Glu-specific endopeptidase
MKKLSMLGLLILLGCQNQEARQIHGDSSHHGVIYGKDSRDEASLLNQPYLETLRRSSVALVDAKNIFEKSATEIELQSNTLGADYNLCLGERFYDQRDAAFCSGVLIGPNLVLTAGHCFEKDSDCETTRFVFNFEYSKDSTKNYVINKDDVFSCKKIRAISRPTDEERGTKSEPLDFAIVELDRNAHAPVAAINLQKELTKGDPLVAIGYPAGIPKKFSLGNVFKDVSDSNYFVSSLDVYGGNSGSPVFNRRTLQLEGLLIEGEDDFDEVTGCNVSKVCKNQSCMGESVAKISKIIESLKNSL